MKSHLRSLYRLYSARWTIRGVSQRQHKQSAAQLGESEPITMRQVKCGLIIVLCFIAVMAIENYDKPDPKVKVTQQVRK